MDNFWQQVAKLVFSVSILLFPQASTLHCKQTSLKTYNSGLGV